MKEMSEVRIIQLRLLEILLEVDKVCKEQNITYYIIGGTLLGAVRHQGFIPWDDDVDIAMPRDDYERFLKVSDQFFPEHIRAKDYRSDVDYFLDLCRVEDERTTLVYRKHLKYRGGVAIDLFPLDGIVVNKIKRKLHFKQLSLYKRISYFLYRDPFKHGRGIKSFPSRFCIALFDRKTIQRKIEEIKQHCKYEVSELISDHYDETTIPRVYYGKPTPILFEGHLLMGVERPHEFLSIAYGDYMKLPPIEERERKQHDFYYLNLNESYKQ